MSLLEVKDLSVQFKTGDGLIHAVNKISFTLNKNETLGIVGESGSGKSQTMMAFMGLSDSNALVSGSVRLDGKELIGMSTRELNRIRGNDVSMIFQDPMTSLNPYLTVETQLCETMMIHQGCTKSEAKKRAMAMLDAVHIPDVVNRIRLYPHEFSGGMRQRVMIAMALMCNPKLLIADEPTTALDVTIQAQILGLLKNLQDEFQLAIVLITHDISVIAGTCDRVMVMYAGSIAESSDIHDFFARPCHPYTIGLMAAMPRMDISRNRLELIQGEPPDMTYLPAGCAFSPRCRRATEKCDQEKPVPEMIDSSHLHYAACFHAEKRDTHP